MRRFPSLSRARILAEDKGQYNGRGIARRSLVIMSERGTSCERSERRIVEELGTDDKFGTSMFVHNPRTGSARRRKDKRNSKRCPGQDRDSVYRSSLIDFRI